MSEIEWKRKTICMYNVYEEENKKEIARGYYDWSRDKKWEREREVYLNIKKNTQYVYACSKLYNLILYSGYILLSIAEKIDGVKFVGVASPDANVVVHSRDL